MSLSAAVCLISNRLRLEFGCATATHGFILRRLTPAQPHAAAPRATRANRILERVNQTKLLSINQQTVRIESLVAVLFSFVRLAMTYVSSGSIISANPDCLVGHGCQLSTLRTDNNNDTATYDELESQQGVAPGTVLRATVSGFVSRISALVSVHALHTRYTPEVGDIVVARVLSLGDERWRLDINSRLHATLLLSSINLPEFELRKRTLEDRLNMRRFYTERDLVCCEVQAVRSDGAAHLHTRSVRYRKLTYGQCVTVHASLIRRCAQHFQKLQLVDEHTQQRESIGVQIILGVNGRIWIQQQEPQQQSQQDATQQQSDVNKMQIDDALSPSEVRMRIARVHNAIQCLSRQQCLIWDESIMQVYSDSLEMTTSLPEMLQDEMCLRLTQNARRLAKQQ